MFRLMAKTALARAGSLLLVVMGGWLLAGLALPALAANPKLRMQTSQGAIELELYADKAPQTVKNFIEYSQSGFYNGTLFHRVMPNFMIQGGGFVTGMQEKKTRATIRNEADNGLKNAYGTLAMARTAEPHSAAAQFFINVADNFFLDHRGKTREGWGYAVFGRVTRGMDIVERIAQWPTRSVGPYDDVPNPEVVIQSVEVLR